MGSRAPSRLTPTSSLFSSDEGAPGWQRSQWGLTVVVFIAFFGFNFVQPILPLYVRELGVANVSRAALMTGLMLGISPLLAAFFAPIWGVIADRYGRKRMIQRSLLVFSVTTTIMGLVANVWQLFALRALIGLFGGFTSMTMAYTVVVAPPKKASAALGMLQSAQVAGLIVGPLSAGFVADHYGLRASFFAGAAVIFAGFVALTLLTQDDRELVAAAKRADSALPAKPASQKQRAGLGGLVALRSAARLPGFVAVMAILFLAQFVDRSFGPILPLYVAALGTQPDQVASYAGSIISLAAIGTGISAAVLGHLAARLPVQRLLLLTLVAGVALCFPMALVHTPWQLLVVRALLGLFAGGTLTLAYSLANQVVPLQSKGAAFGVLSSTALLGSASSPLITGALAALDLRAVFVVDSALYALALFWALRSARATRIAAAPVPVAITQA
ncbi:MAG: MFS transporter [Chloroflexi bacterium]|nr:MFS transporter [Chloroflexota bacterium]